MEGGGGREQGWKMGNYWKHPQILGGHNSSVRGVFVIVSSCVFWWSGVKVNIPLLLSMPCPFSLPQSLVSVHPCLSHRQYKWMRCRLNTISKCIWSRLFYLSWPKSGIFSSHLSVPGIQLPQLKKTTESREWAGSIIGVGFVSRQMLHEKKI